MRKAILITKNLKTSVLKRHFSIYKKYSKI